MTISPGTGGRWAFGILILIYNIVFNETGGATTLFATIIATSCAIFSALCKSSLNHIQLPYLRATQKFDFFCLFLAIWFDLLSLMTACGALARTLSTCVDAMTGGMARIYLLGRNSPENEPWPDVLGVSVVFLLTVMFMLGLENTKVFGCLMSIGVFGMTAILIVLTFVRGTSESWTPGNLMPKGLFGILSSSALCTFSFPSEIATNNGAYKTIKGIAVVLMIGAMAAITAGCLSTLTVYISQPYIAVPILTILEKQDFHKVEPAVACLLVLACSGAFLELFPEMYSIIVRLSTSEWKILARQIGYENNDSGSPVLAIFTGGSLCAMFAFACPIENLIYILAASHLCSGMFRAFYLLYSPYRPKYMIVSTSDASLAYSRLDVTINNKSSASAGASGAIASSSSATAGMNAAGSSTQPTRSSSIWCFLKKPKSMSIIPTSKSMLKKKKSKRDEELEREWLLLGEPPQSPRTSAILVSGGAGGVEPDDVESSILSEPQILDVDCIVKDNVTDVEDDDDDDDEDDESDSSTDIDAIVDEYRQKVKVSTAGPMDNIIRLPTADSWKLTIIILILIFNGIIATCFGALNNSSILFFGGIITVLILSTGMLCLPKYINSNSSSSSTSSPSAITCSIALLFESVLFIATLSNSWPAIIFWILAGIALYVRCDTWCCYCLDHPRISIIRQQRRQRRLIPNVTTNNLTSIHIPCPPRGSIIQSRISGHR